MKSFAEIQLPALSRPSSLRQVFLLNVGFFGGHLLLTVFAALIFSHSLAGHFWPIWPAAGITAYGLLVWGPRVIPGLLIASLLGGHFFIDLRWGINIWFTCSEIMGAWLGSLLLRRFCPGWAGLQTVRHSIAYLLLFAGIPSLFTAGLTGAGGWLFTKATGNIPHLILFWTMAKAAAIINISTLFLLFFHGKPAQKTYLDKRFLLLGTGTLGAIILLFFRPIRQEIWP
ncbi:hypothetical protein [Acidithiobacillus thiooxidans]|uniref:hypothetical protein n=1 Tax=Acidithiobacillus thiooxidans TaxID=930 RepID=UPI0009DAB473|nr:hypothetical protein [Acidithiobacillus thiooxidans]